MCEEVQNNCEAGIWVTRILTIQATITFYNIVAYLFAMLSSMNWKVTETFSARPTV